MCTCIPKSGFPSKEKPHAWQKTRHRAGNHYENVSSPYALRNESAFVNDFNVHFRLLRQQVIGNNPGEQVCGEVVNGAVSGMLYLTDILQLVIHRLNNRTLPEHEFVIEVHQRVLHVPFDFRNQMYVVTEKHLKEILADVSSVGKEFPEEFFRESAVLQRCPVIHVARRELPLYDFPLVVDDQMQLESVEPAHSTLSLGCPALHRLVHVHPLDVARHQRSRVNNGDARTLAQRTGLQEQQQVKGHLCLTLYETVIGHRMGKFLLHMLADIAEVEGLQVAEMPGMEQH